MGLASAEGGLQVHYRSPTLAAKAHHRLAKQLAEAFSQVRSGEELSGIKVLGGSLALEDLPQIGGKLSLDK